MRRRSRELWLNSLSHRSGSTAVTPGTSDMCVSVPPVRATQPTALHCPSSRSTLRLTRQRRATRSRVLGGGEHFLGRPAFGGAPASFFLRVGGYSTSSRPAGDGSPTSIGRPGSVIHSLHDPAYKAASIPASPRAKTP